MAPVTAAAMDALAGLLRYPQGEHDALLQAAQATIARFDAEAGALVAEFVAGQLALRCEEREELYTRTFDLKPLCSLEVGWQLFGEEYNRGAFLVRMRAKLREHGLDSGGELADHLTCVLPLAGRMAPDEAARFVPACLMPAVDLMLEALGDEAHPYRPALAAVRSVLHRCWQPLCEEVPGD